MPEPSTAPKAAASATGDPIVNRLSIQVATVNGSGSQTANNTLLRSIFQMVVPVLGKNLFPSNIAGLPTWFTIRANAGGYIARRKEIDLLVCMNRGTVEPDVTGVPAGATMICDDTILKAHPRADITFLAVPFQNIVKEVCPRIDLRKLVVNMVYVGVLAELLGIDVAEVERALEKAFRTKPKAMGVNKDAVLAGVKYAKESITHRPRFRIERMDKTAGKVLVDGNFACAVGALFAGVTVVTWYPITPSSSLAESLTDLAEKYRRDPATGKTTCAILQAEDELASIGMVIGAAWAGARAMTTTSGPGISLMSEFVGLSYYAEIPAVVFDIQRIGPSTGLPTRTAQGDILSTALNSHGDTRHVMLLPSSPEECYTMSMDAFDLSERLQTIVYVMSDLDLGMNTWMAEPFTYPDKPFDRGKVLDEAKVKELGASWGRYKDVDGDGIPYRSLPGTPAPAFFTRGSGHNEMAQYSERPDDYIKNMERLARKFDTAKTIVPAPVAEAETGATVGIIAYGSSHWAVQESRDQLREENGLETDYLRLRAYPFAPSIEEFVRRHERGYVVGQNRDCQMLSLLRMDLDPALAR